MNAVDAPKRARINVRQFHRMGRAGVFSENARIELFEGDLIEMAPIGYRHVYAVDTLNRLLHEWRFRHQGLDAPSGERLRVSSQSSVMISSISELQPDVMVLRPRADDYWKRKFRGRDLLLLIEVADSSLRYDLALKPPVYARHGVPEVWVLDAEHRCLHIFRKPVEGEFQERFRLDAPTPAAPSTMPELLIDWAQALGSFEPGGEGDA